MPGEIKSINGIQFDSFLRTQNKNGDEKNLT